MQLQQINQAFGMSLTAIEQQSMFQDINIQLSSNIFNNVLSKVENQYGSKFLKFGVSPENYMKYKNGKTSSMIKSDTGGIQKHVGFEAVEMVNLVDSIFMEVDRYYTTQIISQFNNSVNQIFHAINDYQIEIMNQIFYLNEQEKIDELLSFKDFFEDITDELGDIAISPIRASSYISNLIDIRRKNYNIYNFYIQKLENWINIISEYNQFTNNYNPINFNELEKDLYFARQSISTYMICLVYEHIICGNIDLKSKDKIINKLQKFLMKFENVEQRIKTTLIQRDNANRSWNWYYNPHKQYDSNDINWYLSELNKKSKYEISIVNDIFNKSSKLLENVIISENKEE